MDWANFHFLRPLWLLALIPLALLLWRLSRLGRGAQAWARVCDPRLLPHLLVGSAEVRSSSMVPIGAVLGLLCVIAAAGPVWQHVPQPVFRAQVARVFVLDLSASMDAPDVKPSRLVRAKQKLTDMLAASAEGQTGLIVFAGSPHVVSPLTDDAATITAMVPTLSTDLMPLAGSRPDLALDLAGQLLKRSGVHGGQVILIGDDAAGGPAERAATDLRNSSHRVSLLAVGTELGAPVPLREGGFLKDQNGAIVVPRLELAPMQALARVGGGDFVELRADDTDVARLMATGPLAPSVDANSASSRHADLWREEGPWLLLAALPLAALGFRRGWLGLVLLPVLTVGWQRPAEALEWDSLWLNQNQRATQLLQQDKPADAAPLFTDNAWSATANYRAGKYDAASKLFSNSKEDATAQYNAGNAFAKLGRFDQAIAAYDRALAADPSLADAKFNRDLLKKHAQEQANKQDQSSPQNQQPSPSGEQKGEQKPDSAEQNTGNSGKNRDSNGSPKPGKPEKPKENTSSAPPKDQANGNKPEPSGEKKDPSQQASQQNSSQSAKNQPTEQGAKPDEGDRRAEMSQATEQWLRRIPDDPGGLLRRKFLLQLQQGQQKPEQGEKAW